MLQNQSFFPKYFSCLVRCFVSQCTWSGFVTEVGCGHSTAVAERINALLFVFHFR